ncbi:NusG domain II-containing protein [Peptoniphilus rhinitidis]|uniref:NusG domain II-containing protein n=1 Tax=Peptoniphilus rhinitidis TaxID=1175452 RepID=UPI00290A2645|nr:NusG domain II-containing protein [Peptoniphilus rhinitidis]MDU5595442.1 NusG domain II-containing protein [Peptoniphilus rhinitidis]
MGKLKKADILVIFLIVIASCFIYFFTNKTNFEKEGNIKKVVITVDGKTFKEIYLDDSIKEDIDVNTIYGKNKIHIENGEVHMHSSDCKYQICVKMGKIKTVGDSIVCLPNRLIVKIVSEDNNDGLDMVLK